MNVAGIVGGRRDNAEFAEDAENAEKREARKVCDA
jgi:hypothetical protein